MVTRLVFKATILIVAELCSPAISVSNAGARREKPRRHDGEQQIRFKVLCPDLCSGGLEGFGESGLFNVAPQEHLLGVCRSGSGKVIISSWRCL